MDSYGPFRRHLAHQIPLMPLFDLTVTKVQRWRDKGSAPFGSRAKMGGGCDRRRRTSNPDAAVENLILGVSSSNPKFQGLCTQTCPQLRRADKVSRTQLSYVYCARPAHRQLSSPRPSPPPSLVPDNLARRSASFSFPLSRLLCPVSTYDPYYPAYLIISRLVD